MKALTFMTTFLLFISFNGIANNSNYKLDFGVIIKNEVGEPIGFNKTTDIPIEQDGQTSLFGLVVTSPDKKSFLLNSIHTTPLIQDNIALKIMGKPMKITKRGAIFLRTEFDDVPGRYTMEVYINNKLHKTINYDLISSDKLTKL